MKQKSIIKIVFILFAVISSLFIFSADGSFDKPKEENKVLSIESVVTKPIVLAQNTTSIKKPIIAKKSPVKKITKKKKKIAKKKKRVNLNPPIITMDTAPHSAKNKSN
ncbi:MAG: hypothetical protein NTU81_02005 [Candidatus Nomurabacteria bacterium]|nr:hypothetical protein [Candidatus Nomurabacteria bacterium]